MNPIASAETETPTAADSEHDILPAVKNTTAPASAVPGDSAGAGLSARGLPESVLRIPVSVQVIIGTARMPLSRLTQLGPGAEITLDQKLGAPATILVNGKEVARGELFVLDEEGDGQQLGVTITEVLSPDNMQDL